MAERPIDLFESALRAAGSKQNGRGGNWKCPAHDDGKASLQLAEASDGAAIVKCWAGCSTADVCRSLGLETKDLFPKRGKLRAKTRKIDGTPRMRLDVHEYTDEAGQPLHFNERYEPKEFFQGRWAPNKWKIHGLRAGWFVVSKYSKSEWVGLKDERGQYLNDRTQPPPPEYQAQWFDAPRLVLLRLPRLVVARRNGIPVYVVDGESDVKALESLGFVATCRPKGASAWCKAWTEMLREESASESYEVIVVRDRDKPDAWVDGKLKKGFAGQKTALLIASKLQEAGIPVRMVEAKEGKDARDHIDAGYSVGELVAVEDWRDFEKLPSPAPQPEGDRPEVAKGILAQLGGDGSGGTPPREGGGGEVPDFDHTDWGWAERLVWMNRGDLRYCPKWVSWVVWNGNHWQRDEQAEAPIHRRIVAMAREMRQPLVDELVAIAAAEVADELEESEVKTKERKKTIMARIKELKGLESANKLRNINGEARKQEGVPAQPEEFDLNPDILTVRNGVIDLRTGELVEPRRDDLCTKQIDLTFDPDAQCPTFMAFLDHCVRGDADMKRFLMKAVGYTLTGSIKAEVFFFIYGEGGTGKSKFIDAIEMLMGPYAKMLMPSKLMSKKFEDEIPTHFAKLQGSRLVKVPEVDDGMRIDESMIKILTGEQKTAARFMRENEFEFAISFKFWMTGNTKPNIRGTDMGIWRRPLLIEFSNEVAPEDRDPDLLDKFRAELPGILAWAVRGAAVWYREGLTPPDSVRAATEKYKNESDQVQRFIEDCCVLETDAEIQSSKLFKAYQDWAKRNNEYSTKNVKFSISVSAKGFDKLERTAGNFFVGLRLRTDLGEHGERED